MSDRYTKTILTVIAGALIYLCVVMTAFPAVRAQGTQRPGEPSGPLEVVVVGWKPNTAVPIVAPQPLRVITERSAGADRVVLVGWEENAGRDAPVTMHGLGGQNPAMPVVVRTK